MTPERKSGGFSLVEAAVAMTILVFGIAATMNAITVTSRQLEVIEAHSVKADLLYVGPHASKWGVRLGAAAPVSAECGTGPENVWGTPCCEVSIDAFERDLQKGSITMRVTMERIPQ